MKTLVMGLIVLVASCASQTNKPLQADSGFAKQALEGCHSDLLYLNQVLGWQGDWPSKWLAVIANGPEKAAEPLKYWSGAPQALASSINQLRQGIEKKQTAPRLVVLHVQQQVTTLSKALRASNSKYTFDHAQHQHAEAWNRLIREDIAPAVAEFELFLTEEYLAHSQNAPGLSSIQGGEQCFFKAVEWWTSLSLSQEEIEDIGWKYLELTRADLLASGEEGESLEHILNTLRNAATTHKTTVEELLRISENAMARAHKKTLLAFSKQSPQKIIIQPLAEHMQAAFPAGMYRRNENRDASATYVINPSRPSERRLMAEVIAFHESIPGHHLWFSYPRERPATEYNSGKSGLLEGWAIYTEYLADEMALYSSNFYRQGMMAKHLWAASRLIVEPGLHLRGWSREQAITFMLENTVMSRAEIELEVDRYIAMPGQSLCYILGADVILSEREYAKTILGEDFDIKAFHDIVLSAGVRPLSIVKQDIRSWVKAGG